MSWSGGRTSTSRRRSRSSSARAGLRAQDIDDWLERLAPHEPTSQYRHNNGEDNADAHLKRQLMAHQVVLPITGGKLDLGPWEQVFYAEFDGRRRKRVVLKAIGE